MMRVWITLLFLLLSPPLLADCHPERLRFTLIPKKDIDQQIAEYRPLFELLEHATGRRVEVFKASSYDSVIDALVSGGVDFAVLGPAAYALAQQREPRLEPFASLAMAEGHFTPAGPYYHALLLVRGDSELHRLEQLQGVRVALSDPASTSGALIPASEFPRAAGMPLDELFGARIYAGSHDKALDALLEGRVEAAFVSSARADEYLSRGIMAVGQVRELWRSRPIHYDPFVFRAGLCPPLKDRIAALLTGSPRALAPFLASQQALAVTRVEHSDYLDIIHLVTGSGEH